MFSGIITKDKATMYCTEALMPSAPILTVFKQNLQAGYASIFLIVLIHPDLRCGKAGEYASLK